MASDKDRPLRLLSLDGGGVKGITPLRLLQHIFKEVERKERRRVRPHEYFDLIGGTSTGGLIAVMLGVLHMSVEEAILAYYKLAPKIFDKKWWTHTATTKNIGAEFAHYWFRTKDLEDAIGQVLKDHGHRTDKKLMAPGNHCRCFVTARNAHSGTIELLRSYSDTRIGGLDHDPTIVNAVRATSAAPPMFEPVTFEGSNLLRVTYVDGGLGRNNPLQEILNEVNHLWPDRDIGCLISVGTGVTTVEGLRPDKSKLHEILKACVNIATDADTAARTFRQSKDGRKLLEGGKYFRYSVPQGISKDDTDNFKKVPYMEAMADGYAVDMDFDIARCAYELMHPSALPDDIKRRVSLPVPGETMRQQLRPTPSMTWLHGEQGEVNGPPATPVQPIVQSPRQSVSSFHSSTASENSLFDEYMRRGDANLKSPRDGEYFTKLEAASSNFSQALHVLEGEPVREPDRFRQVYKKLMDTKEMLSYSHRAPVRERAASLRQAQTFGSLMKESAQAHGDDCKLAQAEHSIACLKAREVELDGQQGLALNSLLPKRDRVAQELVQKLELIRLAPPPNIGEFEHRTEYWRDRIKNKLKISGHVELDAGAQRNKAKEIAI